MREQRSIIKNVMNYKEKVIREKQLMQHWGELRPQARSLSDLLLHKRDLLPMDLILVFQCLSIIVEKLEIHGEEIEKTSDVMEAKNKENQVFQEIFGDISKDIKGLFNENIAKEVMCLFTVFNDESSFDERFEAIGRIKSTAWKSMYNRKKDVMDLVKKYPDFNSGKEMFLVFSCISMVLLELDMQDQEIKLLEE